jgi:AraC-like DNA-binding protein
LDITREILAMWKEYSRQERGFYHQLKAHLMSVCVALLRHYKPSPDSQEKSAVISAYRTIRPAIEYLERSYAEPLTIQEVAAIVHLSPSRMQSLFKEAAGTTFAQFLRTIRIQAAKELLLRTELPITDIYYSSGFQSHSAFYRAFVQNAGMKPLEYRNRYGAFLLQAVELPSS